MIPLPKLELGKLPVPVGPMKYVELVDVAYGADGEGDDTKPLARLEDEKMLPVPVGPI